MIRFYILGAAALAVAALTWWVADMRLTIAELRFEVSVLESDLATCDARNRNRDEDQDSDNDVDQRTGGGDWTVPDSWLRGDSDTTGD